MAADSPFRICKRTARHSSECGSRPKCGRVPLDRAQARCGPLSRVTDDTPVRPQWRPDANHVILDRPPQKAASQRPSGLFQVDGDSTPIPSRRGSSTCVRTIPRPTTARIAPKAKGNDPEPDEISRSERTERRCQDERHCEDRELRLRFSTRARVPAMASPDAQTLAPTMSWMRWGRAVGSVPSRAPGAGRMGPGRQPPRSSSRPRRWAPVGDDEKGVPDGVGHPGKASTRTRRSVPNAMPTARPVRTLVGWHPRIAPI